MLSALHGSRKLSPELLNYSHDLLTATARRVVLGIAGTGLAVCLALGISDLELLSGRYFALAAALVLYVLLAWRVADRPGLVPQILWQIGLAVLVTAGVTLYPGSFVRLYYALLPFVAAVTIGWHAGVLMEVLVVALVCLLSSHGLLPAMMTIDCLEIIVGGATLGIVGWAMTDPYSVLSSWAVFYTHRATNALKEAQSRAQELEEVREDLMKANQELTRLMSRYKALQKVADEARQAKAEFVANVSHELRAPLNMIIGFSEMIAHSPRSYGTRLPPALLADIAVIQRNATHLARLVDDVLDLSQIEVGRMALSKDECSIPATIEAAVAPVQALYQTKGLHLEVEMADDLPSVFCDQTRICQILVNLLSNAGRFSVQGGVRVKVDHSGDEIVFSVADSGPGISATDQVRLFEPFQQLDNSVRREHGGSGLGLSICKRFVEMHGGRIWLESELGRGTTISFSLPVETASDEQLLEAAPARRWVNELAVREARTRPFRAQLPAVLPRLVLLDQGPRLERLFARYAKNVSVTAVTDVPQALRDLQRSPAQALIVNTPQVLWPSEPFAEWQQLSSLPYETPAIFCWLPGSEEVARRLGAIDYLVKPVTARQLLTTMAKVRPHPRSVLLVDDEPDLLQYLARSLSSEPAGYRVWRATTGAQALEITRERRPDLIVLDLMLPDRDGYQVLLEKEADAAICDIPVIILSARDPVGDRAVAGTVVASRGKWMSARELLALVEAINGVLIAGDQGNGKAPAGNPPD